MPKALRCQWKHWLRGAFLRLPIRFFPSAHPKGNVMAKNFKPSRPDLDRYLADRSYQFASCSEAARAYKMSRARLVRIAKQAKAIHKRHKAFAVDLVALRAYLAEHPEVCNKSGNR